MADEVTAGAHRASFGGGRFGWWVGVMRRWHADIWECGHQHPNRKEAALCAQKALDSATGVIHEPIVWRRKDGSAR